MKSYRLYILLGIIYTILIVWTGITQPRPINWNESFSKDDKIPFGNYILRQRVEDIFTNVYENDESFYTYNSYDSYDDYEYENEATTDTTVSLAEAVKFPTDSLTADTTLLQFTPTAYLIITNRFEPGETDVQELLKYAHNGNKIFISANSFPIKLLDTLGIESAFNINLNFQNDKQMDNSSLNFTDETLREAKSYKFKRNGLRNKFLLKDTIKSILTDSVLLVDLERKILGIGNNNDANFVSVKYGDGTIYLHHYPYAFSNYNMMDTQNREYVAKCFSYINDCNYLVWDEYYKPMQKFREARTPLRFILQEASFRTAYYLGLFTLFLFTAFTVKRRQRAIPLVKKLSNASVEFATTIGSLYYRNAQHHDLALKKVAYLMERLRSQYFIQYPPNKEAFEKLVHSKTGCDIAIVQDLAFQVYDTLTRVGSAEYDLIQLHKAIENFNTHIGTAQKGVAKSSIHHSAQQIKIT